MISKQVTAAALFIIMHFGAMADNALVKIQTGHRDIGISKDLNYNDSFKINAPTAVNIGVAYFITNNIALEGSVGIVWGKFEYVNQEYSIRSTNNDGRIMSMINIAAQYHLKLSNTIKPYIGTGYSRQLPTTFYTSFLQDKEIFAIGGGGNFLIQLGADIKLTEDTYLNTEFKHTLPVSHVLNIVDLGIKHKYSLSNSEVIAGIAFSI